MLNNFGPPYNFGCAHGCHLVFLKLFVRNEIIWPFGHFLAFLNVEQNSIF